MIRLHSQLTLKSPISNFCNLDFDHILPLRSQSKLQFVLCAALRWRMNARQAWILNEEGNSENQSYIAPVENRKYKVCRQKISLRL